MYAKLIVFFYTILLSNKQTICYNATSTFTIVEKTIYYYQKREWLKFFKLYHYKINTL